MKTLQELADAYAQRQTGIGASSIFNCIKQYTHTAGGFKWQYKE